MSYKVAYQSLYYSKHSQSWGLYVMRRGFTGIAKNVKSSVEPFSIDYPDVTSNEGIKNIFDPIRGSAYDMELVGSSTFSLKKDLYTEDNRKFLVQEDLDGGGQWKGWLNPELSEEPYGEDPYYMRVGATDGLKSLESFLFLDDTDTGFTAPMTVIQAIAVCLGKTDLKLDIFVACETYGIGADQTKDPLSQAFIQPLRFVNSDDEPFNCKDVLTAICEAYGLILYQETSIWRLIQPHLVAKYYNVRYDVYTWEGVNIGKAGINTRKQICDHNVPDARDRKLILADNPKTLFVPSLRKVTVETDYGDLANRLYNARFRDLTGSFARGWSYLIGTPFAFEVPNPRKYWKSHYLRLNGKCFPKEYGILGIESVINPNRTLLVGEPRTLLSVEDHLFLSPSVLARVDEKVIFSGRFFNSGCKGVKVQVLAKPISDTSIIPTLKNQPTVFTGPYEGPYTLLLKDDFTWSIANLGVNDDVYTHIFENTKEERIGNDLLNVAKGEWASFSIESKGLPLMIREDKYTHYLVKIALFAGVEYDDNKPESSSPYVLYDNLNVQVQHALIKDDIVKEKVVLERSKKTGKEWKDAKLQIGSFGGSQYYSQLLDSQANPIQLFTRLGQSEERPLGQITATLWLNQYRKPTLEYRVGMTGKDVTYGSAYMMEDKTGPYHVTGAKLSRRSETSDISMTEVLVGNVEHKFSRYNIDSNGKSILIESGEVEGDLPDSEKDLLITFCETNFLSENKITISGSAIIGGSQTVQAIELNMAWFDKNQDGPYTVTVRTQSISQPFFQYSKVYTFEQMRGTVDVLESIILEVEVMTASGVKVKRVVNASRKELKITAGGFCNGNTPMVSGQIKNTYRTIDAKNKKIDYEKYEMQLVDLVTGQIIHSSPATIDYDFETYAAAAFEELTTRTYGIIVRGTIWKDQAGVFGEISRCMPYKPNWYAQRYGKRYKRQIGG